MSPTKAFEPKGQKMLLTSIYVQNHKKLVLQLCYCATFVETTLIAQTNVEFYETAYLFIKNAHLL